MIARLVGVAMCSVLAACTPMRTKLAPPFQVAGKTLTSSELANEASAHCLAMQTASGLPPHPFTTDGCSVWPDSAWQSCCIAHDFSYWCGGTTEQRHSADRELRACVAEHSNSFNAYLMYFGVRVGGPAWMPWPWRWGYGHDWPYR